MAFSTQYLKVLSHTNSYLSFQLAVHRQLHDLVLRHVYCSGSQVYVSDSSRSSSVVFLSSLSPSGIPRLRLLDSSISIHTKDMLNPLQSSLLVMFSMSSFCPVLSLIV